MTQHSIAISTLAMIAGLAMAAPTQAALRSEALYVNTAQSCQLSIPTIDSKVRPRASSYNNEGTTSVFVICGYANPASITGGLTGISLGVRSLNGVANSITCTAVNGFGGYSQTYISKTLSVPATGFDTLKWYPSDFGGGGNIPTSNAMSVTCSLPPNVGFNYALSDYNLEIGS